MIRLQPMIVGVFIFMEEWRNIPNASKYMVSNYGNVIRYKDNIRKEIPQSNYGGYYVVNIKYDNKPKVTIIRVHQLVAIVFLNHKPNGHKLVVDHIDDDKFNNRVDNLQIVTTRYNTVKGRKNKTSKYVGVCYAPTWNGYRSIIHIKKIQIHLHYSKCEHECGLMYQIALDNIDKYTDKKTFVAMVKEIYLNNYVR